MFIFARSFVRQKMNMSRARAIFPTASWQPSSQSQPGAPRQVSRASRAALFAHSGRRRIDTAFFGREFAVLNLASQDIDHELGELVCVAGALLAFRSGRH
jgi:hypothetical protein